VGCRKERGGGMAKGDDLLDRLIGFGVAVLSS
jgi:hypothetical protein